MQKYSVSSYKGQIIKDDAKTEVNYKLDDFKDIFHLMQPEAMVSKVVRKLK